MEAEGTPVSRFLQAAKLMPDRLQALWQSGRAVRRRGTLSLVGVYSGVVPMAPIGEMFDRQITIRVGQANVKRWVPDLLPLLTDEDPLGVDDLATHEAPIEQAPELYEKFQKKQDGCIKVVLHRRGRRLRSRATGKALLVGALDAVRSWVLWWLVLFGLWIVVEGTNEAMELAAGAGAAAVAATLAEALRREGLLAFTPEPRWLVRAWRLPYRLLYEFALVTWAIVPRLRRRPSRGRWTASPFPAGGADARSAGDRAAALVLENVTPNTMAAEIDREHDAALKHDLLPGHGNTVLPE